MCLVRIERRVAMAQVRLGLRAIVEPENCDHDGGDAIGQMDAAVAHTVRLPVDVAVQELDAKRLLHLGHGTADKNSAALRLGSVLFDAKAELLRERVNEFEISAVGRVLTRILGTSEAHLSKGLGIDGSLAPHYDRDGQTPFSRFFRRMVERRFFAAGKQRALLGRKLRRYLPRSHNSPRLRLGSS